MQNAWLLAVICFIAMVSPGPDFLLVTRNALRYPRREAFLTAMGIVAGCLVHATYCTLGLALIVTKSVLLFSLIRYAGAAYLIYLGVNGLLAKRAAAVETTLAAPESASPRQAFLQGFLCNVLNPKLAVFLLSLFTQFISADATIGDKIMVSTIFVTESAIYWPTVVLLLQSPLTRRLFASAQGYVDRICGAVLILLGLRVALERQ